MRREWWEARDAEQRIQIKGLQDHCEEQVWIISQLRSAVSAQSKEREDEIEELKENMEARYTAQQVAHTDAMREMREDMEERIKRISEHSDRRKRRGNRQRAAQGDRLDRGARRARKERREPEGRKAPSKNIAIPPQTSSSENSSSDTQTTGSEVEDEPSESDSEQQGRGGKKGHKPEERTGRKGKHRDRGVREEKVTKRPEKEPSKKHRKHSKGREGTKRGYQTTSGVKAYNRHPKPQDIEALKSQKVLGTWDPEKDSLATFWKKLMYITGVQMFNTDEARKSILAQVLSVEPTRALERFIQRNLGAGELTLEELKDFLAEEYPASAFVNNKRNELRGYKKKVNESTKKAFERLEDLVSANLTTQFYKLALWDHMWVPQSRKRTSLRLL